MKCTTKALVAFAGGIAMISTAAVASPTAAETASGDTAAKQKSSVVSKPFQAVDPAEPGVTTNAQRGINDICFTAIPIACGGSVDADLTLASPGIDESFDCAIGTGQTNTLWYSFQAIDTAATIQTCGTAVATDSTLNVFSGSCGALVEIACAEDECGFLSTTTVTGLTVGETYYIQIGAWSAGTVGTYTLEVDCFADLGACCDFDGNCGELASSDCDFYFTANATCAVACTTIPACPPGALTEGFGAGEFLVDGVDDAINSGCNADFGTAFDDPNQVDPGVSLLCGDIVCGTSGSDLTNSSGGSVRDQDWFIYETVADVILTVEFTSLFDGDIVIAPINSDQTCPDPLNILAFAQTTSGGSASFDITLAPGTYTIWVQTTAFEGTPLNAPYFFSISCDFAVDPVGCCFDDGTCSDLLPSACLTADGTVQADLCAAVTCPVVAVNNDFEGALAVDCNSTFVADLTTASAGTEFAFSCGLAGNTATNTLWYSFVATDSTVTVTSCGTGNAAPADDTIIDVFEAAGLTEVGCSDDDCASSAFLSTVELTGLTVGNTYLIRVGAWSPGDVAAYNIALLCGDPEPEACCFNDGSCTDVLAADCTLAGGVPQGISTSCAESPCCVACDGTEVAEGEVDCFTEYDDLFNSGCNASDASFPTSALAANTAVCGTTGNFATAAGDSRDTDWYSYNHPGGPLTLTVQSQAFSALAGVLNVDATGSNCATGAFLVDFVGNTTGCDPLVLSGDLPAGTYILFVSTSSFSGVPCGFQYTIEAAAGPSCDPTCADATGEGDVNLDDLDAVLINFGSSVPTGEDGDVNCDGVVDLDDLDLVLINFGSSC